MKTATAAEILANWPARWPAPSPGCERCAALAQERVLARRTGDGSRAADCNVRIRTHDTGHLGTP